jgi:putative membrane protein
MIKLKLSVALALVLLVLIVVFQNTEPVATRFLFIIFTMPRAALLAITFLVGAAAGILLSFGLTKHMPKKQK